MKRVSNFLITAIIIHLFPHSLKAQDVVVNRDTNYVVLSNGKDTVFCDIKKKFMGNKLWFKPVGSNTKYEEITPDKIKEYYVKDSQSFYEAVYLPEQKDGFFALTIEKGKINLFQEIKTGTVMGATGGMYSYNNVTWYISKGSNNVETLKYNSWVAFKKNKRKSILEEMIADNKEAADKYAESKKFTFNYIRSIVHFYNTGYWVKNWDTVE